MISLTDFLLASNFSKKKKHKTKQLSTEGELNSGGWIYRDGKRRGIYLALFTDPEGDSCFRIYQISRIKMKKGTLCK